MLQECIIIKVDFKPFLSGVLSLLFFYENMYLRIEVNQASDSGVEVVLA